MKINIFYILSKIYLILILSVGLLIAIFELSITRDSVFWPVLQIAFSVFALPIVVKLKQRKRLHQFINLLIILPIGSYYTLNFVSDVLSSGAFVYIYFNENTILISKIIMLSYYYIPSIHLMMAYKYQYLNDERLNSHLKIPEIISLSVEVLLFLVPTLFVLSGVFEFELTSILATSGILAAIIGLAIQANLSNILSGVFVNIERPFSPDEYVSINDMSGKVIDVTWRSTRIRTVENTEITIPNELVASSVINNWSRTDKTNMNEGFRLFSSLSFNPKHDPQHISQLLQNALKKVKPVDGRDQLDFQWVKFSDVDEYGLKFLIGFDCTDLFMKISQQNAVMLEIHKTLQHAGIRMTVGKLYSQLDDDVGLDALQTSRISDDFEDQFSAEFNPYNEAIKNKVLLKKVPIFMSMNGEELELLAESCKRLHFNQGDSIIKQNDPGDSLYVIADGVVSVQLDLKNGDRKTVSRLGVGDFFGEMSLMTGEPRTAHIITESPTVVINVEKDVIKKIFTNNAHFFDTVSAILAKRKVDLENLKTSSEEDIKKVKNIAADLKKVIMNFLS
ncbi:MAG: mechanosensitive ion channel [Rhodobacteraceae bacterium]|nr:MAG: mechanosensitive ion channel [Paracoccaceae bacterium]